MTTSTPPNSLYDTSGIRGDDYPKASLTLSQLQAMNCDAMQTVGFGIAPMADWVAVVSSATQQQTAEVSA